MQTTIRIFKSLDPLWPWWGVGGIETNTQWFRRKADAEQFARSKGTKCATRAITKGT